LWGMVNKSNRGLSRRGGKTKEEKYPNQALSGRREMKGVPKVERPFGRTMGKEKGTAANPRQRQGVFHKDSHKEEKNQ